MMKLNKWDLYLSFPSEDASDPAELNRFYDSLNTSAANHWYFQEYGVSGPDKGTRFIGFRDLTGLQAKHIRDRAKKHLPDVKVVKKKSKGRGKVS